MRPHSVLPDRNVQAPPKALRSRGSGRVGLSALLLLLGGLLLFHAYSQQSLSEGYTRLSSQQGSSPPAASALFTLQNDQGDVISEAAVEAVQPLSSARLLLDQQGASTGVALVNPGNEEVTAQLQLRDAQGGLMAEKSLSLPAGHHIAEFGDQLFDLPEGFQGSLTWVTPAGVLAGVTLRQAVNSHKEPILAALPIVPLGEPAAGPTQGAGPGELILGHIGAGSAGTSLLSTRIILISTSDAETRGHIDFFSNDGRPLEVEVSGDAPGSSVDLELPGNGVTSLLIQRQGAPLPGYARIQVEEGPQPAAAALFQFRTPSGALISEAGVFGRSLTQRAQLFVDTAGTSTGVAVASREEQEITIELLLRDRVGRDYSSTTLQVPANGHLSAFVRDLFGSLPDGFTGSLEITSPAPISVTGLKLSFNERGDPILTTLPIADLYRPLPAGPWFLPQIGFGPGITTRILLLGSPEGTSTGELSFFRPDGSPLDAPLLGQLQSSASYDLQAGGAAQLRLGNHAQRLKFCCPKRATKSP